MAQTHPISPIHHYIHFSILPSASNVNLNNIDDLTLRKSLSDGLTELFGATNTAIAIDILWISSPGNSNSREAVVRVHPEDAPKVLASVVTSSSSSENGWKISVLGDSPFLPSLVRNARLQGQEFRW